MELSTVYLLESQWLPLVLKLDGKILQSFCICTRASAKSFANIVHVTKKFTVQNFENLVKSQLKNPWICQVLVFLNNVGV